MSLSAASSSLCNGSAQRTVEWRRKISICKIQIHFILKKIAALCYYMHQFQVNVTFFTRWITFCFKSTLNMNLRAFPFLFFPPKPCSSSVTVVVLLSCWAAPHLNQCKVYPVSPRLSSPSSALALPRRPLVFYLHMAPSSSTANPSDWFLLDRLSFRRFALLSDSQVGSDWEDVCVCVCFVCSITLCPLLLPLVSCYFLSSYILMESISSWLM